ncbi:hypothetical protein C6P40_002279 [Pichia californica]|uniref:BolA-like protein n=1 Tax=Pichia californica TaxID=460514 RepID=A0A9P7BE41_9ASCO|nr:hypothetical protein C6P42_000857 [[Candida] californica]KAG0687496.1 hypothetical protein C6P40_002279 [[Candida] californica]
MIKTLIKNIRISSSPSSSLSSSIRIIKPNIIINNRKFTQNINNKENNLKMLNDNKDCKCSEKKDENTKQDRIIGPIENSIIKKIENDLKPIKLIIKNDSWKHSHHTGMKGVLNITESHFHVTIISNKFKELGLKSTISRHRYVFKLLNDELKNDIHGFQVICKTPEEWEKLDNDNKIKESSLKYFS